MSVSVPWNLSLGAYIAHISDWLNTTFGFVDGGPTSARMPPVNATNVSRSDGDWQSWTQEAAAAAGWQNDTLTGVEPNRANYTALIGELYDDFEHISETYLLTTLAVLGIVLNTVAMVATCRERHMRRTSRSLHALFFSAENLFLAGYVGFLQLRSHERRLHRDKEHDLEVILSVQLKLLCIKRCCDFL